MCSPTASLKLTRETEHVRRCSTSPKMLSGARHERSFALEFQIHGFSLSAPKALDSRLRQVAHPTLPVIAGRE
jgi:hypothetical protein